MKALVAAHKILISAAILLSVILVVFGLARGRSALAAVSAIVGISACVYLRHVYRRYGKYGS
ncbi:MAG: hypothetical protein AABZ30_05715 [Myxococcota bacterium]